MSNKVTFYILGGNGSSTRQMTFSKGLFKGLFLLAIGGLAWAGFAVNDYMALRQRAVDTRMLEEKVARQGGELAEQRRQIQEFATEINDLKARMVALSGFENRVRIIANLEKEGRAESLFGVGGSIPDDLDTRLDLTEKHGSLVREMHEQVEQLNTAATRQEEGFNNLIKYLEDQRNLLAATPAIRPCKGWVTSKFGYRTSPFTGRKEFHKGIDIANRSGTDVLATADGVVTFSGSKGLLGKAVVVDHGHGFVTRYGHLKKALKKRGEKVKRGEVIAVMGNTGRSTGPHVHYEVRLNGMPVNPTKYFLN